MIKTEEKKYEDLLVRNKTLEEKNKNFRIHSPESCEKSTQANFLQDSMLKRTQLELDQLEKSLLLKEKHLESIENALREKSDLITIREKNLHQKEISHLLFPELETAENLNSMVLSFKSEIFPELIEDNLWLSVVEPSKVTSKQLSLLQEYESTLFIKHEELKNSQKKIYENLKEINRMKCDLDNRETKVLGLECLKEYLEKEKEELNHKYEEIIQAAEDTEAQMLLAKSSLKGKMIVAND